MEPSVIIIVVLVILAVILVPVIFSRFLTTVDAGTIRLVSRFGGNTSIYKGPGKAIEIPLLTTSTSIPSKAINIDLDIADQTADIDRNGTPKPIKVRVLASAIVSVGDSNEMITTAANKFFSKPQQEQTATLSDLLTSTGRRAVNLLNHDELFSSKGQRDVTALVATSSEVARTVAAVPVEEDDRLALIIKGACSRELQDLGLVFNSLNIKEVQSEVAEARRRQSAVEAKANADIVAADQERRAREAQLGAEQAINDKQRDLEQRRAQNAATVAEAEATKQTALAVQREAELKATQIAQANADAARVRIQAEAAADAEAVKVRTLGLAQADAIRAVNDAIRQGGDAYLALKQLELLPQIVPSIAEALANAKLINISGAGDGRGASGAATDQITGVIQTLLATQLVSGQLRLDAPDPALAVPRQNGAEPAPSPAPADGTFSVKRR
jgi:flotillin